MDDDELTVSSQDSMDDIRRMVAEAQARNAGGAPLAPPTPHLSASDDDDELTVEATDWMMAQINAGLAEANSGDGNGVGTVDDDESTLNTEPRWASSPSFAPVVTAQAITVAPTVPPVPPAPFGLHGTPPPVTHRHDEHREDVFAIVPAAPVEPPVAEHTTHRNGFEAPPAREAKWQPPERMVRPTEPDVPHPHHLARKWRFIAVSLGAALAVVIVLQVVGMLTGDDAPGEAPTETVVGGSTVPNDSLGGG